MSVTLRWVGSPEAIAARFNGTHARIVQALSTELLRQMGSLREYIVATKLSGSPIRHRTGNLINSTQPSMQQESGKLIGAVTVGREAPYGRYLEYGAHFPERVLIRAKAPYWVTKGGQYVFARRRRAFDLPPHPFMRPSLAERREAIITALSRALARASKQ